MRGRTSTVSTLPSQIKNCKNIRAKVIEFVFVNQCLQELFMNFELFVERRGASYFIITI